MVERRKIKDVLVPVRYELVNVTREKTIKKGKETYIYTFDVKVNGAKIFGSRKKVWADNLKELKMHIILFYF